MTETLAIALAQINPTVGDIDGNLDRIRAARAEAAGTGADLVICGELAVSGYPPEDLVLKRAFQDAVEEGVNKLAAKTNDGGPGILIGTPWRKDSLFTTPPCCSTEATSPPFGSSTTYPITASSTKNGSSRPVRCRDRCRLGTCA